MQFLKDQKGFTQFELIITLIIISILAGIASAVFIDFKDEAKSVVGRANEKSVETAKTFKYSKALLKDSHAKYSDITINRDDFLLATIPPWIRLKTDSTMQNNWQEAAPDSKTVQKLKTGVPARSNIGPIKILTIDSEKQKMLANLAPGNQLYGDQFIKTGEQGTVSIGNAATGKSSLKIEKGALPRDLKISMKWDTTGIFDTKMFVFEMEPHGTEFRKPVKLSLSYKLASLEKTPQNALRVFYFNEDEKLWELTGGKVDETNRRIEVAINHFSRYSIAFSR